MADIRTMPNFITVEKTILSAMNLYQTHAGSTTILRTNKRYCGTTKAPIVEEMDTLSDNSLLVLLS